MSKTLPEASLSECFGSWLIPVIWCLVIVLMKNRAPFIIDRCSSVACIGFTKMNLY